MPADELQDIRRGLRDLGGLRVWSLLVTLFGDLAATPGATLSGPVISKVMQKLEVRPEAMRVALHRLRKDGWILSEKSGRESLHQLSAYGRRETENASSRIYVRTISHDAPWFMVTTDPAEPDPHQAMKAAGYAQVSTRLYIGENAKTSIQSALVLRGETAPDWLRQSLASLSQLEGYAALHTLLQRADTIMTAATNYSAADRAVIRCLVVHSWRRLVLKHPDLPPQVYPEGWRGSDCRRLVNRLLDRFPRPDLSEI